jgi:hypothetical protein
MTVEDIFMLRKWAKKPPRNVYGPIPEQGVGGAGSKKEPME